VGADLLLFLADEREEPAERLALVVADTHGTARRQLGQFTGGHYRVVALGHPGRRRTGHSAARLTPRKHRTAMCFMMLVTSREGFMQECLMTDYLVDVRKYSPNASEAVVAVIVKYCGIALQKTDSSLVAVSDPQELATVRDGFAAKKLGLSADAATAGIKAVVEKMKGTAQKSRVTFCYLLAETTGTLDKLS
jgi:hypothetical protein